MASSPTPWIIRPHLPDAHFEVVADAAGNTVGTATRPDDAALIVRAVNERDTIINAHVILSGEVRELASEAEKLKDLVRRMIPSVETALALSEAEGEALDRWLVLLREAREAVGESMKEGGEK